MSCPKVPEKGRASLARFFPSRALSQKSSTRIFSSLLLQTKDRATKDAHELENRAYDSGGLKREAYCFRRKEHGFQNDVEERELHDEEFDNHVKAQQHHVQVNHEIERIADVSQTLLSRAVYVVRVDGVQHYCLSLKEAGFAQGNLMIQRSLEGHLTLKLVGMGEALNKRLKEHKSALLQQLNNKNMRIKDVQFV